MTHTWGRWPTATTTARLLAAVLIATLIAACSGGTPQDSTTPGPGGKGTTPAPKAGGTLKVAQSPDFDTLDPAKVNIVSDATVARQVFEGLTTIDPQGTLKPLLATSWDNSPDGLTWTFHLRKGVKFHDGTDLTAEAVKVSLDRTRDPKFGVKQNFYTALKEIQVVDPLTVVIVLKQPFGPLLQTLAHWSAYVVSPAALTKSGNDFAHQPVGTGPFKLDRWQPGKIALVRNAEYWQAGLPKLDRVEFTAVVEDGARATMLKTGEADLIYPTPPALLTELRNTPDVAVDVVPGSRTMWAEFNHTKAQFQDVRVRKAINLAIDRDSIVKKILNGLAEPVASILAKTTFGHFNPGTYPYNPDQAKQLLKEAGWQPGSDGILAKGGQRFSIKIATPKGRYPADVDIVQAIQAQLKAVGIESQIEADEYATWIRKVSVAPEQSPYDLVVVAIAAVLQDADTPLKLTVVKNAWAPKNWNFGFYFDPEVEEWARIQSESSDQGQRAEALKKIQQRMFDQSAELFLFTYHGVLSRRTNVSGIDLLPSDTYDLIKATTAR